MDDTNLEHWKTCLHNSKSANLSSMKTSLSLSMTQMDKWNRPYKLKLVKVLFDYIRLCLYAM